MNSIVQKTILDFTMGALNIGPPVIKIVGDAVRGRNNGNF